MEGNLLYVLTPYTISKDGFEYRFVLTEQQYHEIIDIISILGQSDAELGEIDMLPDDKI